MPVETNDLRKGLDDVDLHPTRRRTRLPRRTGLPALPADHGDVDALTPESLLATGYAKMDLDLSNFDGAEARHSVDLTLRLQREKIIVQHCAWEFYGLVWWDAKRRVFCERVMHYCAVQEVMSAPSLNELVERVNDRYGWS